MITLNLWPAAATERLRLGSRMARRLLLWTFGFGVAGTLAVSGWEASRVAAAHRIQVDKDLVSIGAFVAPTLVQSLWEFDREQTQLQLESLSRLPYVSQVTLEITGQAPLARGASVASDALIRKAVPLVYLEDVRPHALGTLTLIHDPRSLEAQHRRQMLGSLAGNALVVLLSALGTVVIYQWLVTRRLLRLARETRDVNADDLNRLPPGEPALSDPRDELDDLAASAGALKLTGAQALREIDERHSQVRSLMDNLPDLVWMKDPQGVYLACNPRFATYFCLAEAEFLVRTDGGFCPPEVGDSFRLRDRGALWA